MHRERVREDRDREKERDRDRDRRSSFSSERSRERDTERNRDSERDRDRNRDKDRDYRYSDLGRTRSEPSKSDLVRPRNNTEDREDQKGGPNHEKQSLGEERRQLEADKLRHIEDVQRLEKRHEAQRSLADAHTALLQDLEKSIDAKRRAYEAARSSVTKLDAHIQTDSDFLKEQAAIEQLKVDHHELQGVVFELKELLEIERTKVRDLDSHILSTSNVAVLSTSNPSQLPTPMATSKASNVPPTMDLPPPSPCTPPTSPMSPMQSRIWEGELRRQDATVCNVVAIHVLGSSVTGMIEGPLNVTQRTPLDSLQTYLPTTRSILSLQPLDPDTDNARFQDFSQYLHSKHRAGVVTSEKCTIYVLPPSDPSNRLGAPPDGNAYLLAYLIPKQTARR